jgi:type I restriction-modification system DNA methylase subunit
MQYLSVKDISVKFKLSERRVQQLCDAGRIEGVQRISGVWVIPENAKKPIDDRIIQSEHNSDMISLTELCSMLSISAATGRNWIKLGKLIPQEIVKRTAFFSAEYVNTFKESLKDNNTTMLKSRRNKKYMSGNNIYNSYVSENSLAGRYVQTILDYIESNNVSIGEIEICAIVAECAAQLLLRDTIFSFSGNCLQAYLDGCLDMNGYEFLIDDLVYDKDSVLKFIHKHPTLFEITYRYEENEDVLGLLYISTKNFSSRKASGAYYTPTKVVKRLCNKLFEKNSTADKKILDPCCGTGNFLIQLPNEISVENIFGNDIDEISVKITRINLAIKFSNKDKKFLYEHITNEDYLNHGFSGQFDFIIGNPPWGFDYTENEKINLRTKYVAAVGSNVESYDVFIEQAIKDLSLNGVISFVLPEALLNVKTHMPIRKILMEQCTFQYLDFLGNAFDKVQCPCIIFQFQFTNELNCCLGLEVYDGRRQFKIDTVRDMSAECFSFLTTDEEYAVLNKIIDPVGKCFLADNAVFALGIVTGNNKEYISTIKKDFNEVVLKGSDLYKYYFNESENYIVYKPELFQQVAPTEYYRAPEKLLYRFICNQLVFAYDDHQTLSLNSCNLVIPHIKGLSIKYILAILNSRIAQFYFKKRFNSIKVLKSHIEQIPIPYIQKNQQEEILKYVEILLADRDKDYIMKIYNELDQKIAAIFNLTQNEYSIILSSMNGEKLFL